MAELRQMKDDELHRLIASGQGGHLGEAAYQERQRRLLSGDATLSALERAVNDLVGSAPTDHDVLILAGDLAVHKVAFLEPHTFLFEGIDQNGRHAAVVIHYTQVNVRVVYRPKRLPDAPRVITGFSPNAV